MLNLLVADASHKTCKEFEIFCDGLSEIRLCGCLHNGVDVLHTIKNEHIDVLLMDIVMPELDGLGVLTEMQAMQQPLPAVFIHTAFLDSRLLQELQRLGVVYCFVKPMGVEHIIPRILQLTREFGLYSQHYEPPAPVTHNNATASDDINGEITKQIRAVGIPAHLRGYHYLRVAIQYSVDAQDPSSIAVTKEIYPYISKIYNTRSPLVERAIRNAIEVAWTRGNTKVLHQYFGYTIDDFKGKPTNAEFIAMIADRVRMVQSAKHHGQYYS